MGNFVKAEEMRTKLLPAAKNSVGHMEPDDLDDLFIVPAERMIEQACNLRLNTDYYPADWSGRFETADNAATLIANFQSDYKKAVFWVVNMLAANPMMDAVRRVGNASTIFSNARIPPQARAVMQKWSAPRMIYRT